MDCPNAVICTKCGRTLDTTAIGHACLVPRDDRLAALEAAVERVRALAVDLGKHPKGTLTNDEWVIDRIRRALEGV